MTPYRRYRQRLLHLMRAAAEAQRYWTVDRLTWDTFCLQADADGIAVVGLLRDLQVQMLDSSPDGDVRLG